MLSNVEKFALLTLELDSWKSYRLWTVLVLIPFAILLSYWMLASNCMTAVRHFDRALNCYITGDFEIALGELDQAIALSPHDSVYFHARANVYFEMREYCKAINDYNMAVLLKPDDAAAYGKRGWSYQHLGQAELASKDWKTCQRILNVLDHGVVEIHSGQPVLSFRRYFSKGGPNE